MAEVLVIGKKISEMGLVNEITGEEKIPTSASGDKAVTTGQLLTYVNNNGVAQWGRIGGDITNQVDLQNQFTQERDTLKSYTQEYIDATNEVFKYTRENGSALPYKEGVAYEENAIVVKDGELQQWRGGEWRSAVAEGLSDTIQTFNTTEAGVDPVTGVADGAYFNVRSTDDDAVAIEYQNVGGSAIATGKSYPSSEYVRNTKNWSRNRLYAEIKTVNSVLDAQWFSIWEFASFADTRGSEDPALWDWSPALTRAIDVAASWVASPTVTKTSPIIVFSYGEFNFYSKIDYSTYDNRGLAFQWTLNILGSGQGATTLRSRVANDHLFYFANEGRVNFSDLTFSGQGTTNSKLIKVGDENATEGSTKYMHWSTFNRVTFAYAVEMFTLGRLYDSSFNDCSFRYLTASATQPSYYLNILPQATDNCNQIAFFRTGFEGVNAVDTFYSGSSFIKADGGTNNAATHYSLNFYGCHLEGGGKNLRILDLKNVLKWNFNGCYLVQTYLAATKTQNMIKLERAYGLNFEACFIQDFKSVTNWDSSYDKLIKFVGNNNANKFNNCYFKSSAISTEAYTRSYETVFDTSESDNAKCYVVKDSIINSYQIASGDSYVALHNPLSSNMRHFLRVGSDHSLNFSFGNSNISTGNESEPFLSVSQSGRFSTRYDFNIGSLDGVAGDKRLNFSSGSGASVLSYIQSNNAGQMLLNAPFISLQSNFGNGDLLVNASSIRPSQDGTKLIGTPATKWLRAYLTSWDIHTNIMPYVTATSNIGASGATINNIYLQNAPIVVSDERHKSNVRPIDDALLDAWGTLDFKMWQLNAAVEEKGTENARWHTGLIAQQVKDALTNAGLDWTCYGLITYESWEATEAKDAGEIYMLRMEECFAVEAAYQRRRLDRIEDMINSLSS